MKKILTLGLLTIGLMHVSVSGYMLAKAHLSQYLIQNAWQMTLDDKSNHKPWSWADTYPVFELKVPRIKSHSYVLADANGRNMAFSVAHMSQSGMPGTPKTTIVSGHNDSHFQYLQQLKLGDKIYTTTKNSTFTFIVNSIRVVNSENEKLVIRNKNELVLTTCYPFNTLQSGGKLRYVIIANQV